MASSQGASTSQAGAANKSAMDKLAYIERYDFQVQIKIDEKTK